MFVVVFVLMLLFSILISYCLFLLFFFKQKTAYEMRISDWRSDVCSSDLDDQRAAAAALHLLAAQFDLERAADIAREHARDRRAGRQLDIGQVAAIPFLVMCARDAARHPGDVGKGREGGGRKRRTAGHGGARLAARSEEHTSELQSLM